MADGIANVGFGWHCGQKYDEKIQDVLVNWIQGDDVLRQRVQSEIKNVIFYNKASQNTGGCWA
jgi:hypothetical protein